MKPFLSKLALLLGLLALLAVGCTDSDDDSPTSASPSFSFVGSESCRDCYFEGARADIPGQDVYDKWVKSGHPYKVVEVNGRAPVDAYPDFAAFPSDVVEPPLAMTWDQISYLIGGYYWKLRFIMDDGYIATGDVDDTTQYNFATEEWVDYHAGEENKKYDCGRCHTTGWIPSDDDKAANNKDQLEGLVGWFFAGGVHCEACHGPGGLHASAPEANPMLVDTSSELCGQCHMRDSQHRIAASGGFVRHHEQYDEWLHSPHQTAGVGCNDCHDPHSSVVYDDEAPGEGVTYADEQGGGVSDNCKHCHTEITTVNHLSVASCVDCHMPKSAKSATAANAFAGDVSSHIWTLLTDPVGKEGMFDEGGLGGGGFVMLDSEGQAKVSLDFACYRCHTDPLTQTGGGGSEQTLAELAARAAGIHMQ